MAWVKAGEKTVYIEVNPPENPITGWEVYVPSKVEAGKQFTVTVKVYARRQTQVKAELTLFGMTYSKTGYAYSTTTPGTLTFTLTAPNKKDKYSGKVVLYYYK